MKQKIFISVLVFILFTPMSGYANEANNDSRRISGLTALVLLEGLAVVLSYGAAEDPNMVGVIEVFTPFYFIFGVHPPPGKEWSPSWDWRMSPLLGSFLAAGIYNINVDEDAYSKSDVFKTNLSILSVGMLASYLLMPKFDETKKEESPDYGFVLQPGKVAAVVTFHF